MKNLGVANIRFEILNGSIELFSQLINTSLTVIMVLDMLYTLYLMLLMIAPNAAMSLSIR